MPAPADFALGRGDYERFLRLVRERSGLEISDARRPQLERAVTVALRDVGLTDPGALLRRLANPEDGRRDLEAFIGNLTVGETHFFRNRAQFEALERQILPDLISRRRPRRRLRLWSAGCASGEEAYSLAILVTRLLPDLREWDVLVLGTDIDTGALSRAAHGLYGPWSFRGVPDKIRERHFIPRGRELEVDPRIRSIVAFRHLNLIDDAYPSLLTDTAGVDVILCRNVLMYFSREAARLALARLGDALAGDGWLLLGHADPSEELDRLLVRREFPDATAFQKVREMPGEPPRSALPNLPPAPSGDRRRPGQEPGAAPPPQEEDATLRALEAGARQQPADGRAAYLAAKFCADRLDLAGAHTWIAEALRRDPLLAPAHLLRALVLEEEGRTEAALDSLRRCIYADPAWALAHFALASLLARLGEAPSARRALDQVTRLLSGGKRDDPVPEGDGLSVGRLRDLGEAQRELLEPGAVAGGRGR